MAVFNKIYNKLTFEVKLYKETNAKIAILQFVRDFLIRDGMRLYNKVEYAKQDEIKRFLKKDLATIIKKYRTEKVSCFDKPKQCNRIWVFWGQGFENAPSIVKQCNKQLHYQASKLQDLQVIELDLKNYEKYVQLPKDIVEQFNSGSLSIVNFSDILRSFLLRDYGGGWIDATVFMSSTLSEIYSSPVYTVKHELFKEKEHICKGKWSSFFMGATQRNVLFPYLCDAFSSYCQKHSFFIRYFLIDCLIAIGYEEIEEIRKEIDEIKPNNRGVFLLVNALKNDAKSDEVDKILRENTVHKMAYQIKGAESVAEKLKMISEREL